MHSNPLPYILSHIAYIAFHLFIAHVTDLADGWTDNSTILTDV